MAIWTCILCVCRQLRIEATSLVPVVRYASVLDGTQGEAFASSCMNRCFNLTCAEKRRKRSCLPERGGHKPCGLFSASSPSSSHLHRVRAERVIPSQRASVIILILHARGSLKPIHSFLSPTISHLLPFFPRQSIPSKTGSGSLYKAERAAWSRCKFPNILDVNVLLCDRWTSKMFLSTLKSVFGFSRLPFKQCVRM